MKSNTGSPEELRRAGGLRPPPARIEADAMALREASTHLTERTSPMIENSPAVGEVQHELSVLELERDSILEAIRELCLRARSKSIEASATRQSIASHRHQTLAGWHR
jgi:hypothetical protein